MHAFPPCQSPVDYGILRDCYVESYSVRTADWQSRGSVSLKCFLQWWCERLCLFGFSLSGGLSDEPGGRGLVVGVNDVIKSMPCKSISREDVARVSRFLYPSKSPWSGSVTTINCDHCSANPFLLSSNGGSGMRTRAVSLFHE